MPYSAPLKKGDGMAIHVRAFLPHFLLSLSWLWPALPWGGVGWGSTQSVAWRPGGLGGVLHSLHLVCDMCSIILIQLS